MKTHLAFFFILILGFTIHSAYAEIEKGQNFDRELLQVFDNGTKQYKWTSYPERISDNGIWKDYKLFQDSNIVTLETANSGSFVFDKNACAYNLYDSGLVGGSNTAKIKGISWTVKGKAATSQNWSNVNGINSAACSVSVSTTESTVKVTGSKTTSAGTFQIVLDYIPGTGIKETMRAYNNNPAWNNHNIGFTETFEVPRVIWFGTKPYDLSQHNGTVFDRNWIGNNTAKLVQLSNKVFYDFGIGWDNLNDIKIIWDGSKAKLSLNYLYPTVTVPYQTWFEVDPTFTTNNPTVDGHIRTVDVGGAACGAVMDNVNGSSVLDIAVRTSGGGVPSCARAYIEWPTTSIPDAATITDVDVTYDVTSVQDSPATCNWKAVSVKPSTSGSTAIWNAIGAGASYVAGSTGCQTAGDNKSIDLGATADTNLQALLASDYFPVGIMASSEVRDINDRISRIASEEDAGATPKPTLTVVYNALPPDPITDLTVDDFTANTVDLSWSAPNMNGGTLQVYQLNYTTPCGTPLTALPNGTTATSYTVSGLTGATCYSFRATAATESGRDDSGNIVNVTTLAFNQANFTVGDLSFDADNADVIPIFFERDDISDTALYLNVTYPDTWELACDFTYKFAIENRTYRNLSFVTIDADSVESSFQFNNVDREVIDVICWNQNGTGEGRYVITQSFFPLLEYVQKFDDGQYGTSGSFGTIDIVYLAVIIVSLVGLNRTNESVGAGFMIVITAAMAYFEFITIPTAAISGIGLVVMLIIITTRKD